jgi:hypothetical protein
LLRQHLLSGLRDKTAKRAEAHRSVTKVKKNQRLPFSANYFKGGRDRTISTIHGIFLYTKFQIGAYLSIMPV